MLPDDIIVSIGEQIGYYGDDALFCKLCHLCQRKNTELTRRLVELPRPAIFVVGESSTNPAKRATIPFWRATTASIRIDWGDGSPHDIVTDHTVQHISHPYAVPATYTVRVYPYRGPNDDDKRPVYLDHLGWDRMIGVTMGDTLPEMVISSLVHLQSLGSLGITSLHALFSLWIGDVTVSERLDTSSIIDMSYMFFCSKWFNEPIGYWNTRNVKDMSYMFFEASIFNQPIGDWDTRNVTSMQGMFRQAEKFNQPIGKWNTGQVTNMDFMFYGASTFNQPIEHWNTSNVVTMSAMFKDAVVFNQSLSMWDTSKVRHMGAMFLRAESFDVSTTDTWEFSSILHPRVMPLS